MPALTEAEAWAAERKRVAARQARQADAPTGELGDLLIFVAIVLVLSLAIWWPR